MALFPWEQANLSHPVEYICPHCKEEQRVERGTVLLCSCTEAIEDERLQRQRMENFRRMQEERKAGRGP